jgi:hypothetical protein
MVKEGKEMPPEVMALIKSVQGNKTKAPHLIAPIP